MTMQDGHPYDDLATYTLELLPGVDQARVEMHLETCAECRAEVTRFRATTSFLAFAPGPALPPVGARAALLSRMYATKDLTAPFVPHINPKVVPLRRKLFGRLPLDLAAAFLGAVVIGGAAMGAVQWQRGAADRDLMARAQALSGLTSEESRHTSLAAATSNASARLVYDPASREGSLALSGLPAVSAGMEYHVWLGRDGAWVPAGSFNPAGDGSVAITLITDRPMSSYQRILVTLEPSAGSTTPSAATVLSGTF